MLDSEELQETRTVGIVVLRVKDEVERSAIDPHSFIQEISFPWAMPQLA
jgi:hypothetical protein